MKSQVVIRVHLDAADLGRIGDRLDRLLPEGRLGAGVYEVRLEKKEQRLPELLGALDDLGLEYDYHEERRFRPREITEAPALRVEPTMTLEAATAESAMEGGCPACGRGGEQAGDLVLMVHPNPHAGLVVSPDGTLFVDERVARALIAEKVTGCLLRGTRSPEGRSLDLFQVLPTNTLPPLRTPPTRVEASPDARCPVCGEGSLRIDSLLYYDVPDEDIFDVNVSCERCDAGSGPTQQLVISQRLFRLLASCRIQTLKVEPVVLV